MKRETDWGLAIQEVYTPEDVKDLDYRKELNEPGEYPFARGTHRKGYRTKDPSKRMTVGFGTPGDTNRRLKYLRTIGEKGGISIVEDKGSQMCIDSDHPMALGEVGRTTAVEEAYPANVDGLLSVAKLTTTNIDVGVANGADHLRQGDVVSIKLVQIDFDFVLFGGAPPGVDLHDAFDREEPPLHDPVLHGAQVAQAKMRWAHDLVAIDFANQARSLDLRLNAVG